MDRIRKTFKKSGGQNEEGHQEEEAGVMSAPQEALENGVEEIEDVEEEEDEMDRVARERTGLKRDAKTAFGLGKLHVTNERYESAQTSFSDALTYYRRAWRTLDSGDNCESEKNQKEGRILKKGLGDCYYRLGGVAILMKEYDVAKDHFVDAQSIYEDLMEQSKDPKDAKTTFGLGKLHVTNERYESTQRSTLDSDDNCESEKDQNEGKTLKKDIGDYYYNLGGVEILMKEYVVANDHSVDAQSKDEDGVKQSKDPNYKFSMNCKESFLLAIKGLADTAYFEGGHDDFVRETYDKVVQVLETDGFLGWTSPIIGDIYLRLGELALKEIERSQVTHIDDKKWKDCLLYFRNALSSKENADDIGKEHLDYAVASYSYGVAVTKYADFLTVNNRKESSLLIYSDEEEKVREPLTGENDKLLYCAEIPSISKEAEEMYNFAIVALEKAKDTFTKNKEAQVFDIIAKAYHFLGYCYFVLDRQQEAVDRFQRELQVVKYLNSDPDKRVSKMHTVETLDYLGTLYFNMGNMSEAIPTLKKAIQINSLQGESLDIESNLVVKLAQVQYNRVVKLAQALYSEGEYSQSLEILTDFVPTVRREFDFFSSQSAKIETEMARNLHALSKHSDAIKRYERALKIYFHPYEKTKEMSYSVQSIEVLINLGHAHFETNYYDKALGCYLDAIDSHIIKSNRSTFLDQYRDMLKNTGFIYKNFGDYDSALQYYEEALYITAPNSIEYIHICSDIATSMFQKKSYKSAQQYYLKSVIASKHIYTEEGELALANSLYNMAIVCLKFKNFDGALKYLQKSKVLHSKLNPNALELAEVCNRLGYTYGKLTKYGEAFREHLTALTTRMAYFGIYSEEVSLSCESIANICLAQGSVENALTFYYTALETELGPDKHASILFALGNAFIEQGDYDAAFSAYEKSFEVVQAINPKCSLSVKIKRNIAMLTRKYNPDKAQDILDEALEIAQGLHGEVHIIIITLYIDKAKIALILDKNVERVMSYLDKANDILAVYQTHGRVRVDNVCLDLKKVRNIARKRQILEGYDNIEDTI